MNGRSFPPSLRLLVLAAGTGASLLATPAAAQRILGPGEDAVTLARGALRVGAGAELTMQRDRWRDGLLEGLGGALSGPAFGPLQFSLLGGVQQIVRDLGVSDFAASLGASHLDARQRLFITPLSIEYGLAEWLTLGVSAPLVRTSAQSRFLMRGDSGLATLGMNPIFAGSAVAAANLATIDRYVQAATGLAARRDACVANAASAPECPTLLAELAAVNTLVAGTSQFASGLTTLYGTGTVRGQRYVPVAGSAAESALLARVDSIRIALERYGVTSLSPTTGLPLGAQVPLTAADLERMVADSTDGFGAQPLRHASLTALGDVTVAAKIKLFDSFGRQHASRLATSGFGLRQSLLVQYRIGTGTPERADEFLDLGSGTGLNALSLRSLTDVVVSQRFWSTLAVGLTKSAAGTVRLRVPSDAGTEWLESWREADVPVTPGARLDAQVSPRWQLNDYIAVGATWQWRRQDASRHAIDSTVTTPLGTTVPLLGRVLDDASASDEQRAGWTATFSTLSTSARGRPGLALEIGFSHVQSLGSSRGTVPKQWVDQVQVRYYTRFLGR